MPRSKKICPFTDNSCSNCRALFAEEGREKYSGKMSGCHIARKNLADDNNK